ncbi:MAG: N-acetylmuramoyl-L-alanine amidase [Syntrophomonadaceae bacterium]|nr:N-acetylmuramoyl-L-alanine amidase [Syntrophomonadaceae bacterium]
MKICIDPGHGGWDPGAVSGVRREKDYTLRLGLRVAQIVTDQGHEAVLTRSADVSLGSTEALDLAARCKIASGCGAMLSIHLNSAVAVATGLEVLFETENNRSLAQAVLSEILKVAPAIDRKVKVQKLGALPNGGRAVLAEMGFINNPADVKMLEAHFEQYCQALVRGLFKGLGLEWKEEEDDMVRYEKIEDVPADWGRDTIQKLIDKDLLAVPDDGKIDISRDMLRVLVINDRMGLYN